jgi:hypothetical protein
MSKLWKEIKDNIKEWSTTAIEKAEEVSKMAVGKTNEFAKISKIKLDIRQTQKDLDNVFQDLGKFVYTQAKNVVDFKTSVEFKETIKKVDDFKTKIKKFEKDINNIKVVVEKTTVVEKPKKTTAAKAKSPSKKTATKKATTKK